MTPTHETTQPENLLGQILERVESIDRNVEEILDRVSDHLDDAKNHAWCDSTYSGDGSYE